MCSDLHTLVVYVNVDCVGGELGIYHGNKIVNRISTKTDENYTRCILLDGVCYHKPEPIFSGKRFLVSYRIPRKKY